MAGFSFGGPIQAQDRWKYGLPPLPANQQGSPNSPVDNQYKLYNSAVGTQAEDYSGIMQGYKDLLSKVNSQPQFNASAAQITPQQYDYKPTQDVTQSLSNLNDLSQTGGYSQQGINDLRERGISPIRSVYAGANRDVDRKLRLQGGFSPNYNATKAKMAREQSDSIANQITNVNAGIAQNVASNRLQAAPQYANAAGNESQLKTNVGLQNTGAVNTANQWNAQIPLLNQQYNAQNQGQQLQALQGMQSLYGTTPALSRLFGDQAMNASNQQNQIDQNNRQLGTGIAGRVIGSL